MKPSCKLWTFSQWHFISSNFRMYLVNMDHSAHALFSIVTILFLKLHFQSCLPCISIYPLQQWVPFECVLLVMRLLLQCTDSCLLMLICEVSWFGIFCFVSIIFINTFHTRQSDTVKLFREYIFEQIWRSYAREYIRVVSITLQT